MADRDIDILVSGGGIAGLIAAAAFGAGGHRVLCVDPAPPVTEESAAGADLRTTAFLQPSVALLRRIGLWDRLAPHAAPLQVMRIVDAGGAEPVARLTREFDASEISGEPFGYNLPNWLLRREMTARLAELPGVSFRPGTGTAGLGGAAPSPIASGPRAAGPSEDRVGLRAPSLRGPGPAPPSPTAAPTPRPPPPPFPAWRAGSPRPTRPPGPTRRRSGSCARPTPSISRKSATPASTTRSGKPSPSSSPSAPSPSSATSWRPWRPTSRCASTR